MPPAVSSVSTLEDHNISPLTASESDRALEQLWKDPNAKIDDFTKSFEQLRSDLDTGTLQYNAIVMSKALEGVETLGSPVFSNFRHAAHLFSSPDRIAQDAQAVSDERLVAKTMFTRDTHTAAL